MPQMITTRKTTNQTAHRAQQDGTVDGCRPVHEHRVRTDHPLR
jgi:hypothetical protein